MPPRPEDLSAQPFPNILDSVSKLTRYSWTPVLDRACVISTISWKVARYPWKDWQTDFRATYNEFRVWLTLAGTAAQLIPTFFLTKYSSIIRVHKTWEYRNHRNYTSVRILPIVIIINYAYDVVSRWHVLNPDTSVGQDFQVIFG